MKLFYFTFLLLITTTISFSQKKIYLNEIGCNISVEGKKFVSKVLDYELKFYESFLEIPKDLEMKVSIYGNHEVFKMTQKIISKSRTNSAFYSNKHNQVFINYKKTKSEKRILNVIAHESSHYFIASDGKGKLRKWINEGMSEYFEQASLDTVSGTIQVNPPKKYIRFMYYNFKKNNIDLKDFIGWSNKKWKNVNKAKLYSYKLSWGIVNYLFKSGKDHLIKKLITTIKKEPTKSKNIVNKLYKGGIKQLEKDMKTYYNQLYKTSL